MKKIFSILLITIIFVACKNKEVDTIDSTQSDASKYPYSLKKVQGWQMNSDSKNMITAMMLIKTFEKFDTAGMGKILADSVEFDLDGYQFKGTKSLFLKQIQGEFAKMASFKIDMEDAESVINKDKSEECVSLWYNQISTTKEGKIDTINLYNDIKLKNGKVIRLSEYAQHPMKKL
ncbi:hypothetical protein [Pedobacter mucosus]|uniref:hypothetical protein n=1 Tax=Pedobacter mucosus TaxID=2895286 RepID=UPI001EE4E633|nr:hypothetical protein [Pedobacter mucosus]UKT65593.1 hypothetical protein LOK61_07325 [Pedobacter mucosus]